MEFSSDLIERELDRVLKIIERACENFDVELNVNDTFECGLEQDQGED